MVQVAENWADVEGTVAHVRADERQAGFTPVELRVKATSSVADWPNMFVEEVGRTVLVDIPDGVVNEHDIGPGSAIALRVRRTSADRSTAEPSRVRVEPM